MTTGKPPPPPGKPDSAENEAPAFGLGSSDPLSIGVVTAKELRGLGEKPMNESQPQAAEKSARSTPLRGSTEFAETLIEFGDPILEILSEKPDRTEVEEALELLVSVWNAHALALPAWGSPELREQMQAISESADSPLFLSRVLAVLAERRNTNHAHDARVAEDWEVSEEGPGYVLVCQPRLPLRS